MKYLLLILFALNSTSTIAANAVLCGHSHRLAYHIQEMRKDGKITSAPDYRRAMFALTDEHIAAGALRPSKKQEANQHWVYMGEVIFSFTVAAAASMVADEVMARCMKDFP